IVYWLFFFFQAEDGIRDFHVTGVQTCALPIYDHLIIASGPRLAFNEIQGLGPQGHTQSVCHVEHAEVASARWQEFVATPAPIVRSEERRVGKEGRCRWSQYS